ncbi:MAG: MFS transporter [Pedosphaera sp.]|nr:MFS transporter [Pedosphaera sp.]
MSSPNNLPASEESTSIPFARKALILLILINLFNYLDRQVLSAVVPYLKESFFGVGTDRGELVTHLLAWCQSHLGFKPENALIGVLSMAFMLVYMLGAPLFARLADKHSRWLLIGIGVTLWSVASFASGIATTFVGLLITRCFVGIGESAYGPVAPSLISDLYPIKKRGAVLAWFYMAIPVGSALGYILGEAVAKSSIGPWGHATFGLPVESWRWAFYVVMPPGLLLGAWCLLMREPKIGQSDLAHQQTAQTVSWKHCLILCHTPSYVYCTLGMAAMTFAIGGIAFWMPYYLETERHIGGHPVIVFGAITVVAGLAATLLGGLAGDRLRARFPGSYFLVSGVAMLLGFPMMILVLQASATWIWVFMFFTCFCLFFNTGPTSTIIANVTHPAMRARAFAINIFVIHALGDVISPLIIGMLSDHYQDMGKAFWLVAFMFLVGGGLWLLGARHLEQDTLNAAKALGA